MVVCEGVVFAVDVVVHVVDGLLQFVVMDRVI